MSKQMKPRDIARLECDKDEAGAQCKPGYQNGQRFERVHYEK